MSLYFVSSSVNRCGILPVAKLSAGMIQRSVFPSRLRSSMIHGDSSRMPTGYIFSTEGKQVLTFHEERKQRFLREKVLADEVFYDLQRAKSAA